MRLQLITQRLRCSSVQLRSGQSNRHNSGILLSEIHLVSESDNFNALDVLALATFHPVQDGGDFLGLETESEAVGLIELGSRIVRIGLAGAELGADGDGANALVPATVVAEGETHLTAVLGGIADINEFESTDGTVGSGHVIVVARAVVLLLDATSIVIVVVEISTVVVVSVIVRRR